VSERGERTVDIHHLAAPYALDALEPDERAEFEAHYPSCEVCRADVLDFRATLAALGGAVAVAPPADLKRRVLAEAAVTRQLSPVVPASVTDLAARRRRRRWITTALAAAAALVLFVAGALVAGGRDRSPSYADQLVDVLGQPDGQIVTLAGEQAGAVRVAWSSNAGRAVVLADGLPPAPDGMAYELWLIDASGPAPMELLDPAAGGEIGATIDIPGQPAAWGVTLEPRAGSPAPTGEILFSAEV
jgi:anti-sigma-K factor RskA